jgi:hypothetical protein
MPDFTGESDSIFSRSAWKLPLQAVVCAHCDWSFLMPAGPLPERCPHCFQGPLASFTPDGLLDPELVLPFSLTGEGLAQKINEFAQGIPFPPADLTLSNLRQRLQRVYLPRWLVDSDVAATWQAEAGFDYQVLSHQEEYHQNHDSWSTAEVTETRVRWEPRLGRLHRTYLNVPAPALEEALRLAAALGPYPLSTGQAYTPSLIEGSGVRLPNRAAPDAWPEAQTIFFSRAQEECQRAAGAQHLRNFQWEPEFLTQHWTLLLEPVYVTYYQDDAAVPQRLWINGCTGQISGARRGSMKRAQTTALWIGLAAALIFIFSLFLGLAALIFVPLALLSGLGIFLAALIGVGALVPLIWVWWFNRRPAPPTV